MLAKEKKPNVVLVLVDDLGWADLACYGSSLYETPHLDRLAREGMRFTDAYAACAVCSPTRAAVMTGLYPGRIGITDWIRARFQGGKIPAPGAKVPEYVGGKNRKLLCPRNPLWLEHEEVTLAEALKPAGYVSAHVGKWHLGPDDWYPKKQGFDFNYGGCDFGQPPSFFDPYSNKRLDGIPTLPPRKKGEYLSDREADESVQFIEKHREKPFFLFLANYAVHTPIQAKADVTAKYAEKIKKSDGGLLQKNAKYAAMVESVDDAVGRVLETLDRLDLSKSTLVIFTSDNGGLLGPTNNKPLRSGKGNPYEGGIRVPLIVRWPGIVPAGKVSKVPVTSVDYFPTVLSAAKVERPKGIEIDGVDLMPLLRAGEGKSIAGRDELFWHFPHYRGRIMPYSILRKGDWKLLRRYEGNRVELYNLADDLGETKDLAKKLPDKVAELEKALDAWIARTGSREPKANPDFVAPKRRR